MAKAENTFVGSGALPRLIRVADIQARFGLRRWQVYFLAKSGLLPTVRVGRSITFPAREAEERLEQWLRDGSLPTPSSQADAA